MAVPPETIDVVIPVYGAADALGACLESVERETDRSRHRVILVVDGPQDDAVESLVTAFSTNHGRALVLRNEQRLGFVHSVNRGMRASSTDVVLLNSDTIVTPRWLEKLTAAAYSSPDIGTVTPLSNHATLCSVPQPFEENLLPTGFDAVSFAALVESASARTYRRIPTGVGVCLYIRRALLDDIGVFDGDAFGLGYGEENDFCMRALARGWLHVADDATFILHAGHRSFGASRVPLQRKAIRTLRRLHPRYMATIAELMKQDPLAPVRARIQRALGAREASTQQRRIVHVVHGWPPFQHAGTELYAYWLVRQQKDASHVSVYVRGNDPSRADGEAVERFDDGVRVRIVTNRFTARNPFARNAIRDHVLERDFQRFLEQERPDLIHIHHLAGHVFSLATVARQLRIPIVMQIQDWWFLCARVNLFDREGNRCTGPGIEKCAGCVTLTRVPPAAVTNRILHAARRSAVRKALATAGAYIAGSEAIREDFTRAGAISPSKPFYVIPYGVDIPPPSQPRRTPARPIRFGYVGSIAPHKGVHTAVDAMQALDPSAASLHLWGDPTAFPDYAADLVRRSSRSAVAFEGGFLESQKPAIFSSMDVLLVPSIGLESFGLAAREAMTYGVPVIATAGGALSEMFAPEEGGEFFPAGDVNALHSLLLRIIETPGIIDTWSAHLPVPKRNDVHASEIARVYDGVLKGRMR